MQQSSNSSSSLFSIMENFIKQMRVRFSSMDEEIVEETSVKDHNAPSPRTRSFKGDNRRGQTWYRRQSSREQRYDYDSDYMESDEFRTAVAAAAFAVGSVQEQRRARRRRDDSLRKGKSKLDDGAVFATRRPKERISSSSSFPSNKMKIKDDNAAPVSTPNLLPRKSSELQEKVSDKANRPKFKGEVLRETAGSSPFVMKTSDTFEKQSDNRKPESGFETSSHEQPTEKLTFPPTEINRKHSEPTLEDVKADVWEKTEMEKIKDRYERLNAKILEWETEKKAKAEKKLSRNKDDSGKKRARALQSYKTDMEMIDQIADGARLQAEENQRKEVIKVKEKADMIRVTGKIPTKGCLCF
ncbi:hypothetical protein LXL04_025126 [Taraxacum kok-saghyz]